MVNDEFERRNYERLLPPLGLWIDERRARRFRLVESPKGFVVSTEPEAGNPAGETREFSLDELEQLARAGQKGKSRQASKAGSTAGLLPVRRETFFAALGFDLDSLEARSILLDEVEDGILLSYSFIDASQGYLWRKRMTVIDRRRVKELLEAAELRRTAAEKRFLGFLRRGRDS